MFIGSGTCLRLRPVLGRRPWGSGHRSPRRCRV